MSSGSLHLIGIVVQTNHIATRESRNLPGGFADTTANVKNSHSLIDLDSMGKVVLVARESLEQSLTDSKTTQVERLGPAFFVEVGC
jgi:hypothetical protein